VAPWRVPQSILYSVMPEDSSKIYVTLPAGMRSLFDQLVARNLYGGNSAVARYLITIGLERLVEQNRLIDPPTVASSPSTDETPDA
jgi:hypothetical protein